MVLGGKEVGVLPPRRGAQPAVVIVADAWPAALLACGATGLRVAAAYVPTKYHQPLLTSKLCCEVSSWFSPYEFPRDPHQFVPVVVSGTLPFLAERCDALRVLPCLLLHVRITAEAPTNNQLRRLRRDAFRLLYDVCDCTILWKDHEFGGATCASFCVGFRSPHSDWAPPVGRPAVVRSVGHFLEDTTATSRHVSRCDVISGAVATRLEALEPRRGAMPSPEARGALLPQGLMPASSVPPRVLCPSVFHPGARVVRRLSANELRRVFNVPRPLDHLFPLGCEACLWQSPSPNVYSVAFLNLWGMGGGCHWPDLEGRGFHCPRARSRDARGGQGGGWRQARAGALGHDLCLGDTNSLPS